jgi:hypothetical protein
MALCPCSTVRRGGAVGRRAARVWLSSCHGRGNSVMVVAPRGPAARLARGRPPAWYPPAMCPTVLLGRPVGRGSDHSSRRALGPPLPLPEAAGRALPVPGRAPGQAKHRCGQGTQPLMAPKRRGTTPATWPRPQHREDGQDSLPPSCLPPSRPRRVCCHGISVPCARGPRACAAGVPAAMRACGYRSEKARATRLNTLPGQRPVATSTPVPRATAMPVNASRPARSAPVVGSPLLTKVDDSCAGVLWLG